MPTRDFSSDRPSREFIDYLDQLSDDLTVISGFVQLIGAVPSCDRFSDHCLKIIRQRVNEAALRLQEMAALSPDLGYGKSVDR